MAEIELLVNDYKKKTSGLSQAIAEQRLQKYGKNEIIKTSKTSALTLFINQFKDFIIMVLLTATLISVFLGEFADAVTIIIIVILNAILGFVQEYRTEKSLEALKELSAPHAIVIRDGIKKKINASEIVYQDLLVIETGSIVPADCILVEANSVQANESILTGESMPVEKEIFSIIGSIQKSTLYMGTTITSGRGKAIVTAVGMNTEMGSIAHMMNDIADSKTPLQERLSKIGKQLVLICLVICALIMVMGTLHGETLFNMLLSSVSLAVAAIPEGLPAIVTVALAIGVQKMLKNNALVRRLPAVETLGCTNIICSDKTGTLTQNKMTVKKLYSDNTTLDVFVNDKSKAQLVKAIINKSKSFNMLLSIGAVCNNAQVQDDIIIGDPTEVAIYNISKDME
jgi:Ca2+-transporting ATPase